MQTTFRCIAFLKSKFLNEVARLADDNVDALCCSILERTFGLFDERYIQIIRLIAPQIETFRSS